MCGKRKEIIAGRVFYFMPSPIIVMKVTVREIYMHEKMLDTVSNLEKTHPIINNIVVQEEGKLWFEDIGVHLQVIRYTDDEINDWKEIAHDMLIRFFDLSKEPGIGIAVLEHKECFDVLIAFHHIYGDGLSVKWLMSDLLHIYSTGNTVLQKSSLTELGEKYLIPEVHISEEMNEKLNTIIEKWNKTKPVFDYERFRKMKILHNKLVRHEFVLESIKGEEYCGLKKTCKKHNITVNSAIVTALVCVLQSDEGIQAIIPIDTRALLGCGKEKGLANFASSIRPFFQYNFEKSFWDNAVLFQKIIRGLKKDVKKSLENLYSMMKLNESIFGMAYFAQYGMFQDTELITELQDVLDLDIQKRTCDFTNIGEMVIEGVDEKVTFSDCYVLPNYVPTCECAVAAVSTNDTLALSLGYSSRHISPDCAENIMRTIVDKLLSDI